MFRSRSFRIAAQSMGALILISVFTSTALGKTIRVERWGVNTPGCGGATSPCQLISYAVMNVAARNDKIVVGPGLYLDNVVIDTNLGGQPLEGLKLESTGGRNATIIDAADSSEPVIMIEQHRVQVGKIGKGFTLTGATNSNGISSSSGSSDRLKIEGNLARDNRHGFYLAGDRQQVRYNISRDNTENGFYGTATKSILRDNLSQNNIGSGFNLIAYGSTIERNKSVGNEGLGFFLANLNGKEKIRNNVAMQNESDGIVVGIFDQVQTSGNIVSLNDGHGLEFLAFLSQVFEKPSIKQNVAVANGVDGFRIQGGALPVQNARVDGNHAIDNQQDGMEFSNLFFASSMNSNNTYQSGSGCGIRNNSPVDLAYKKQFLGSASSPDAVCDVGSGNSGGTTATKPSAVRVSQASRL